MDPEVEMINPADWDVVCDVRTPDEFQEDHLIGAINTPVLSNEQRAEIGTLYKQMYVLVQSLTSPAPQMLILVLACTLHRLPELFISLQRSVSPLARLCYQLQAMQSEPRCGLLLAEDSMKLRDEGQHLSPATSQIFY